MPLRVALFLPEPKNPYQQSMAAEAAAACERFGFVLMSTFFAESSGGDLTTGQVRQIYAAIHAPAEARPDATSSCPSRRRPSTASWRRRWSPASV